MAWNVQTATETGIRLGLLRPGETATGGLLQQRANAKGINLSPYIAAANAQPSPGPVATPTTGAMPVGIEPLHQYEKAGLAGLGQMAATQLPTQAAGAVSQALQQPAVNPMTMQALQQALQSLTALSQPLTAGDVSAGVETFQNPFTQQVTEQAVSDLSRDAAALRNRIESRRPGQRSFGSSSQGVQLAELDRNLMEATGRTRLAGLATGYDAALANFLNQRAGQAGLAGQIGNVGMAAQQAQQSGAGTVGSLAGLLGNLGVQQQEATTGAYRGQIGAGGDIRAYNQGVTDLAMQNYMQNQQAPLARLGQISNLMGFTSPQTSYSYTPMPGTGQQIGGTLMQLGGLAQSYNPVVGQPAYSPLPMTVRPQGATAGGFVLR